MKTKIFTLLMTLFAFAWSAKADQITSLKLTISHNGGEFFEVSFPAQGWPDLNLTDESTTSIRIKRVEVQTSGTVSNVVFKATMYKTEKGLQPDDDWRTFDLPRQGNTWVLDFGDEAPDLIDSEMGPAPRTFQFFVQAQDGSGNAIYYNNGGQDYKVLFVNGGGSGSSGDIKNLTLTIRLNGGEAFTQDIPAENFPIVDLTDERTTSLIIVKVEVEAKESVSDLQFTGTMYSASEGGPSNDDEWRSYSLQNKGNGKWELDMGEGFELVEPDWLNKPKTKTFEFYVQGTNGSGSQLFYNNGGANYKVTFSTGESTDWKIKFLDGITAGLTFSLDGEDRVYNFNGAGDRVPEDQLGQLSSLAIDGFALQFHTADGVKTNDVSLQYRIYEEGQEPEGGWSRIDATHLDQEEGNKMFCYAEEVGRNVTNGLEPNRVYILEAHYQVVVDGEYIFLGKNKESSKFRFTLMENVLQDEIYSVILTLKHNNGEPYEVYFEHENQPTLNLEGQTTSLKIMKAEVWTSEGVQSVNVVGTMYNTENGGPTGGNEWRSMPLSNADNGYWLLDFGKEGYEIVEDEWLNNNKSKTFQFYVTAVDRQGNGIVYDNEGQDYKVSFTTGGSSNTSPIKSFKITVDCDGEEFTESFPSEGWSQHYIEGLVSSIKVMRVEAETNESMSNLGFCWTIYDTADGWQHDNSAWGWQDLMYRGDGHWDYEWGKGLEFIESDWIFQNVTKTLEFFVSGEDSNGITHKYGNGVNEQGYDNNYKVTFTTGIDPDGVRLIPASTADGTTYNLAGQRVGKDYKGIVVTGGRKVLVK